MELDANAEKASAQTPHQAIDALHQHHEESLPVAHWVGAEQWAGEWHFEGIDSHTPCGVKSGRADRCRHRRKRANTSFAVGDSDRRRIVRRRSATLTIEVRGGRIKLPETACARQSAAVPLSMNLRPARVG